MNPGIPAALVARQLVTAAVTRLAETDPGSGVAASMAKSCACGTAVQVIGVVAMKPGGTSACAVCSTAVLLVSGPAIVLWCHGRKMRVTEPVRCSEVAAASGAGGLIAGQAYQDPATSATLRCTRSGGGWPESRAGALVPVMGGRTGLCRMTLGRGSAGGHRAGRTGHFRGLSSVSRRSAAGSA